MNEEILNKLKHSSIKEDVLLWISYVTKGMDRWQIARFMRDVRLEGVKGLDVYTEEANIYINMYGTIEVYGKDTTTNKRGFDVIKL